MTNKDIENNKLDNFFHAEKSDPATPSNALMARVLADAEAEQARFAPVVRARVTPGRWQEFLRALGGWPAMAGLATATVAGVWLGVSPPGILPDATGAYLSLDGSGYAIDAAPGLGFDLIEEAL